MKLLKKITSVFFPTLNLRNSATVKYAFSLAFILAALFGMANVSSTRDSSIILMSNKSLVEQGSEFSVDVIISAMTPINAVDIALSFPDEQIEVLGIDRGESVLTLWTKDPFVKNGVVYLEGGTFQKGFIGEHKIATINARALKPGEAKFITSDIKLLAGDGKGTVVQTDKSDGEITAVVYEAGTQPPTTLKANGSVVVVTDVNGDGNVTITDISVFMANWNSGAKTFDFDRDGKMTFRDFSIILADYFLK